ncbi:MAG: DNA polymerase III subunit gamma/tau [Bacteroidales bacterium]|nr:DNA polymerase III subunit gamma/tau [Bacteroidales bacterium]
MAENYIVSARKYRPQTFRSVVGQTSITETLKNAIRTGKVAQSYLFCGPRGVGKTTCARILAKTLNCFNRTDDVEACNVCESCLSFLEQRSFNIHELDAASNNSVDDIRQLCEQVHIPPQVGRYSIYIIDEVHMLSTQAFNAFLKTLEEPPAHAIFIFATTEKHKIIPTILSRCQIFDFNRIRIQDIVQHLGKIADEEGIHYEPEALHVIAEKADGGMRDALSIFDQMTTFCNGEVTYRDVIANLNVLDYAYFFRVTDACLQGNFAQCLLIFKEITDYGFDGRLFINGLADHFRNLLVSKDAATVQLLEVVDSVRAQYAAQAAQCSEAFLFAALDICQACDAAYKTSRNQRLSVELALIKLANLTRGASQPASSASALPDTAATQAQQAAYTPVTPAPAVPVATATSPAPQPTPVVTPTAATSPAPLPPQRTAGGTSGAASVAPQSERRTAPATKTEPVSQQPVNQPPAVTPISPVSQQPAVVTPETPPMTASTQPAETPASAASKQSAPASGTSVPEQKTTPRRSSGFSIKAALADAGQTVTAEQPAPQQPRSGFAFVNAAPEAKLPFTAENLSKAWADFAAGIEASEPRLSSALALYTPELDGEGRIVCRLPHRQMANDVNDILADLRIYLDKTLENKEINIRFDVDDTLVASGTKYITTADKLRALTAKNPVLRDLQDAFTLELE